MRNKKKIRILCTILLLLFFVFCITNTAFAEGEYNGNFKFGQFDSTSVSDADTVAKNAMGTGIQTIKVVAYGIAIVMLLYIGMKYMMAAPSERADLKKSLVIFVLGAVMVFAAGTLVDIIFNFASNNGLA